jgi:hypothetical protein
MTANSTADTIWQIIRYILLAGFGWLSGKGYISTEQTTAIIGALGALFTAGWGIFVKWNTVPVKTEVADAKNISTVSSATGGTVAP